MGFESDLQDAIVSQIQTSAPAFENSSVVINDWSFKDSSGAHSPFFLVADYVDFAVTDTQRTVVARTYIVVSFTDWKETLDTLRDARDEVISALIGKSFEAGGVMAYVNSVHNGGEIVEDYDPTVEPEFIHLNLPLFVSQQINVEFISGMC